MDILSNIIYVPIFILSIFFFNMASSTFNRCDLKKTSNFLSFAGYISISILSLVVLSTFRKSGTDTEAYADIFRTVKNIGIGATYPEKGWVIFNYLMPSYECVLFVSALVFLGFSALAIYLNVKEERTLAWVIVILVFFQIYNNIMRQMIACAILLFGYYFVK